MSRRVFLFVIFPALAFLVASANVDADRGVSSAAQPAMPATEPGWDFKSPAAREAKRKYDALMKEAETKFARAITDAQKSLIEDLEATMKEATRAADLDEALKLRAALESVQRDVGGRADRSQLTACLPVGRWSVEFANGVAETCEIRKDGTAGVAEPQRTSDGTAVIRGGSLVIAYQDDRVERWTPIGPKMVVEHWFPIAKFPSSTPVLGIAHRLQ
ncbi:MAG TPA: hypothetical protein VKE94_22905 [Gemmataceae bacterium]|nr:hypothetical protein [Gemmataceae bacterium]